MKAQDQIPDSIEVNENEQNADIEFENDKQGEDDSGSDDDSSDDSDSDEEDEPRHKLKESEIDDI